jgi:hypothetical protein
MSSVQLTRIEKLIMVNLWIVAGQNRLVMMQASLQRGNKSSNNLSTYSSAAAATTLLAVGHLWQWTQAV